jgi:hypothetical protein
VAAPSFHSIPGNKSPRYRHGESPAAPGRRRVFLPPRPIDPRNRQDPAENAVEAALRSTLKQSAADAINAVLRSISLGDGIPPGLGRLAEDDVRHWLFGRSVALDACQEVRAFREAQCGAYDVQPISCRCRVCPDCERTRSSRVVRETAAILEEVPANRRTFIVLTVRNTARLVDGFAVLDGGYTSLRRRPLFRGGRCRWRQRDGKPGHPCAGASCSRWAAGRHRADRNCPDFRHAPVLGGGRFDEVTYKVGDDRPWHPHANLLLDAPYLLQAELADTWRSNTCTDPKHRRAGWCPLECDAGSPVVWIQRVDPGTVREAVKYVTKAADLIDGDDPVQLVEFMLATKGRRMVRGFGTFFGLELVESEPIDEQTVTVVVATGIFDREGTEVKIRYTLARYCRQCGKDTKTDDGCTYEPPVLVPRIEARLRNGALSWRPPPRELS